MPHYMKNIQSFLTGRVQIWYLVFKGELCVKIRAKEFFFFYYFNGHLSQKAVQVCWWKWMHTIFEAENLKPFLDTQFLHTAA